MHLRRLQDRTPRVTGEDGLKALEIAVAAENSYLQAKPCSVAVQGGRKNVENAVGSRAN